MKIIKFRHLLLVALLIIPMFAGLGKADSVLAKQNGETEIIIAQNMPQLNEVISEDSIDLTSLWAKEDGTYVEVTKT